MSGRRYRVHLGERYLVLAGYSGILFIIIGLLILAPAGLVPFFPEEKEMIGCFLWPGASLVFFGAILHGFLRPKPTEIISLAEGAVLVVIAWGVAILAGAIPFYCAGICPTQAFFEATSGWTTTGLSVVDVATISPLLLFFRSLLQLAGGAGLAILMLGAMVGPEGVGLSSAEGRSDQLVPQMKQSARLVVVLYSVYTAAGIAALKIAGMTWFDAANHAFCAVSTGGFSTRNESVAFWNSPAIEAVLIVLMLLGTLNFLTAWTLCRGQWRAVIRNGEVRILALLLTAATAFLYFGVTSHAHGWTPAALREAIFQATAALSTTGYATVSFSGWNSLGWMIIIILMLIGGGSGSTAGGIKQHRIYLLAKALKREFLEIVLPPKTVYEQTYWTGNQRRILTESDVRKTGLYIALYFFTWLAGGSAISSFGHPLADSLFEFASCLGTVGLSTGITRMDAPAGQLWIEIAGMAAGRLEFFVIFWGITKLAKDLPVFLSVHAGTNQSDHPKGEGPPR